MKRTLRACLVPLCIVAIHPFASTDAAALQDLRTEGERSDFAELTTYDGMMAYLGRLDAASPDMRLDRFGRTHAGRDLPYAVFSRPSVRGPSEARALNRPVVVLAAGVHGHEPTLRESVLIIARKLATPGTHLNALLDDLTVLIVPQLNPDGFSVQPRPQRGNPAGADLNRDYFKLEQPEIRGYVEHVLLPWEPHLLVDGHDGGAYPYNLNYQCPSHPAVDPRIPRLCDEEIFPAIDRALGGEGYRSWYYRGGTETRWDVGETLPRMARNYGGLSNIVALLFESPGGQSVLDGVRSGVLAYESVLDWSMESAELLMSTVAEARREAVELGEAPFGEIPLAVEYAPEERTVEYLLGVGRGEVREIVEIRSDSLMKRPVVTRSRPRPWAYLLPPEAEAAVELLRLQGIDVEVLEEPVDLTVDVYTIAGIDHEAVHDHLAATLLEVETPVTRTVSFPTGAYLIRTGQTRGRVAALLMEPESPDGLVYWSRMDSLLPDDEIDEFQRGEGEAPFLPIYKLMAPEALPTIRP